MLMNGTGLILGGELKPVELTQVVTENAAGNTGTFSYDATGGNRFVIAILSNRDAAVRTLSSATLDGVVGTIIEAESRDTGIATSGALVYWVQSQLPTTTGTYTLVQNWNASDNTAAGIWQFQNVNQTNPINFSAGLNGTQWAANATKTLNNSGAEGTWAIHGHSGNDDDGNLSSNSFTHPPTMIERYDKTAGHARFVHSGADEESKPAGDTAYSWINKTGKSVDSYVMFTAAINSEV